ncbi:MAG: type IV pilus twitching motility protein PilT [Candidatus Neomarinimicrobiota bacterium]|nr:MAG: type IV pilus twitching motility protein PilT [Candidatus Neomarinimicrobiota bacterium]
MNLIKLLTAVARSGASDFHLSSGYPPIIRKNGETHWLDQPALSPQEAHDAIYGILTERQIALFEEYHEVDLGWNINGVGRFRVNVYSFANGIGAAFRVIPERIWTLEDIKAPPAVYKLAKTLKGLILVTGATGSGKSTTLAAIVDYINSHRRGHILTIEDPIEFVHKSKKCLITQREIGTHSNSFANALRAALREDPDVILVGEMRDLETISLALTAAETGHLVLGTLHTGSAPEAADRVIDVFPSSQHNQIRAIFSSTLEGVIAQKLVKTKQGDGRIAAMEIMLGSTSIKNLIREQKSHQLRSAIQTSTEEGMQTGDQALLKLLDEDLITLEEAQKYAEELRPFEEWAGSIRNVLHSKRKARTTV